MNGGERIAVVSQSASGRDLPRGKWAGDGGSKWSQSIGGGRRNPIVTGGFVCAEEKQMRVLTAWFILARLASRLCRGGLEGFETARLACLCSQILR